LQSQLTTTDSRPSAITRSRPPAAGSALHRSLDSCCLLLPLLAPAAATPRELAQWFGPLASAEVLPRFVANPRRGRSWEMRALIGASLIRTPPHRHSLRSPSPSIDHAPPTVVIRLAVLGSWPSHVWFLMHPPSDDGQRTLSHFPRLERTASLVLPLPA
jgi:hypothetical protein